MSLILKFIPNEAADTQKCRLKKSNEYWLCHENDCQGYVLKLSFLVYSLEPQYQELEVSILTFKYQATLCNREKKLLRPFF